MKILFRLITITMKYFLRIKEIGHENGFMMRKYLDAPAIRNYA